MASIIRGVFGSTWGHDFYNNGHAEQIKSRYLMAGIVDSRLLIRNTAKLEIGFRDKAMNLDELCGHLVCRSLEKEKFRQL